MLKKMFFITSIGTYLCYVFTNKPKKTGKVISFKQPPKRKCILASALELQQKLKEKTK